MRPNLALMFPFAVFRVQWIQHRMFLNQLPHLPLRELIGLREQFPGVTRKMNHVMPLIIGRWAPVLRSGKCQRKSPSATTARSASKETLPFTTLTGTRLISPAAKPSACAAADNPKTNPSVTAPTPKSAFNPLAQPAPCRPPFRRRKDFASQ